MILPTFLVAEKLKRELQILVVCVNLIVPENSAWYVRCIEQEQRNTMQLTVMMPLCRASCVESSESKCVLDEYDWADKDRQKKYASFTTVI